MAEAEARLRAEPRRWACVGLGHRLGGGCGPSAVTQQLLELQVHRVGPAEANHILRIAGGDLHLGGRGMGRWSARLELCITTPLANAAEPGLGAVA